MISIDLKDVFLDFPLYNTQSFSLRSSIVKAAIGGVIKNKNSKTLAVSALKNISFSLEHGDRLGLIGHNGSGKTTLLKLLAGIYSPTSGQIQVKGKISTLFDVLLGTSDEMTGNENLYLSSLIRGKSIVEAKNSLKNMGDFTELGDYLSVPMCTYSAGMRVRIGFSVATEGMPDILLIDEVFGAGDKNFIGKSIERLTALIEKAGILVFSSHSEDLLKKLCNKIMILEHGEIKFMGNTEEALSFYHSFDKKKDNTPPNRPGVKEKLLRKEDKNKNKRGREELEKEELILKLEARIAELEKCLLDRSKGRKASSSHSLPPALDKVG